MTAGDQFTPVIASLANGGHVVAWASGTFSTTGSAVAGGVARAQVFDAAGQKAGSEITVFSPAGIGSWIPGGVAGLPDGSFVVGAGNVMRVSDTPDMRIYAQKVDASGHLVATGGTSDVSVNGGLANLVASESVASSAALSCDRAFANADGGYALVLASTFYPTPVSSTARRLQNYDAAGAPVGSPVVLNAGFPGTWPALVPLANGNILSAASTALTYSPIEWRIVTRGGQVIADQLIGAAPGNAVGNPAVGALADGTGVIVHSYADSMTTGWKALHIDAAGTVVGSATLPIPTEARFVQLTGLAGGGYVTTWLANGSNQVTGRYFTSAGQPAGDEFVVASGVTTQFALRPFYALLAVPGGFVAVYQAAGDDGQEIYEIRFTAPSLG